MDITAKEIIKYRTDNDLTQQQLGDLIGVSRNTVYNYEKGYVIPDSKLKILEGILRSDNPNIGKERFTTNKFLDVFVDELFDSEKFRTKFKALQKEVTDQDVKDLALELLKEIDGVKQK